MLAEVKRIQDEGVSQAERDRAVTAAESQHAFATETAEGRAYAYGFAETLWTLEGELRYLDGIRGVTPEQIREAARRYLSAANARLVLTPGTARDDQAPCGRRAPRRSLLRRPRAAAEPGSCASVSPAGSSCSRRRIRARRRWPSPCWSAWAALGA